MKRNVFNRYSTLFSTHLGIITDYKYFTTNRASIQGFQQAIEGILYIKNRALFWAKIRVKTQAEKAGKKAPLKQHKQGKIS
ncbi:MAG: hypothetical protein J6B40_00815 [Oscillospiraceae bacterium]|nr:hypothetical protein [Oscillospiraceae bacterium]